MPGCRWSSGLSPNDSTSSASSSTCCPPPTTLRRAPEVVMASTDPYARASELAEEVVGAGARIRRLLAEPEALAHIGTRDELRTAVEEAIAAARQFEDLL